jgi:hypothetical protein
MGFHELTGALGIKCNLKALYTVNFNVIGKLSLSPTALQPGVGLGLPQEFPPSFPV